MDDVDRALRDAGAESRATVRSSTDIETDLMATLQRTVATTADDARLTPSGARRAWPVVGAAAALVALLVGMLVIVGGYNDGVGPAGTVDTRPHESLAPATTVLESPIPESPTPTENAPTSTARPSPPNADLRETWSQIAASTDVAWEPSGIARTCGLVWWQQQQMEQERCTQLTIDPVGVPISYDPTTRTVTRHLRDGGPAEFRLPDEFVDPSLIAAGPDDVVYFALDNPWPKSSDVLAVSINRDDAGTVLERFPEVMGIYDADLFRTPNGLVLGGWRDQGPRPAPDAVPFVEWIHPQGGDADDAPLSYPGGSFDDASGSVFAGGWAWFLSDGRLLPGGGSPEVLATLDGGFLASYTEHDGELRAEVIRGYRDSSVEHWLLPGSWFELGMPILEPQGTILIPNGSTFVRVAPFAARPNGWDGELRIDPATASAEAVGLNEFLEGVYATIAEGADGPLPWDSGPIPFTDAIAGPVHPAETRTVRLVAAEGITSTVEVVTEGFLDDSVFGERLTVHLTATDGGLLVDHIEWATTCQPGRGHQDFRAALCT